MFILFLAIIGILTFNYFVTGVLVLIIQFIIDNVKSFIKNNKLIYGIPVTHHADTFTEYLYGEPIAFRRNKDEEGREYLILEIFYKRSKHTDYKWFKQNYSLKWDGATTTRSKILLFPNEKSMLKFYEQNEVILNKIFPHPRGYIPVCIKKANAEAYDNNYV